MTIEKPERSAEERSGEELLCETARVLPERSLLRHRRRKVSQSNRASNTIAQVGSHNTASLTNVQANFVYPGHGDVTQSNSADNLIVQLGGDNSASLTNVQSNSSF